MKKITSKEWKHLKYHGYASNSNGKRYILTNIKGATVLMPVEIIKKKLTRGNKYEYN